MRAAVAVAVCAVKSQRRASRVRPCNGANTSLVAASRAEWRTSTSAVWTPIVTTIAVFVPPQRGAVKKQAACEQTVTPRTGAAVYGDLL